MLLHRMYNYCSFWEWICSLDSGGHSCLKQKSDSPFLPQFLHIYLSNINCSFKSRSTCELLYFSFPWEQHQTLPSVLIICCWYQLFPVQSTLDPDQGCHAEPFLTFSTPSLPGPHPALTHTTLSLWTEMRDLRHIEHHLIFIALGRSNAAAHGSSSTINPYNWQTSPTSPRLPLIVLKQSAAFSNELQAGLMTGSASYCMSQQFL